MNGPPRDRYVLLPKEGVVAAGGPAFEMLTRLPPVRSTAPSATAPLGPAPGREIRIVDSARENGPRLVEADSETVDEINRGDAPVRLFRVVEYAPPDPQVFPRSAPRPAGAGPAAAGPAQSTLTITCTDATTGIGVPGARAVALAAGTVGDGVTDAAGTVTLQLPSNTVDRLYVYPPVAGYWGAYRQTFQVAGPLTVALTPIDLTHVDSVRHYYASSNFDDSVDVQVGVIDTGVGPHTDLNLVTGVNTVTGEDPTAYLDPHGHGTHVAGLIGSNGTPPSGLRGLAPGVKLRAYRVFPDGGSATNYAILKAMLNAAREGCDIVNLSLGGGPYDEVVAEAVRDARINGMVVVVATGNDQRASVAYPAAYPQATAITAMGREGTFGAGSLEEAEIVRPPQGTDQHEFIAGFSNVGSEVAGTAPGVGCMSTIFGNRFGVMSGTSMAAPVTTGAVACLLSRDPVVHAMNRDAARSDAIDMLLTANSTPLGFGATFEGNGMPDPAIV